jgi:hypothetical protein
MTDTFQFPDFSVSHSPSDTLLKARYFGGAVTEDFLSLSTDVASIEGLANQNGNLSWRETDGTLIAISSEIDYLSTADHYYMNLNTSRSADIGFVMNGRTRAIISNEWLEAYENGDLVITYSSTVGGDGIDTVIDSDHGQVIFADYDLRDNLDTLQTIQFLGGGIILDFGLTA